MVSDRVKFHLAMLLAFAFVSGLIVLFVYLAVVTILIGQQSSEFLVTVFFSVGYVFVAIILVYLGIFELIKGYLGAREYLVPERCSKCEEKLYSSTVEWIKENRVKCPVCDQEIEVTKGWDV